MGMLLSLRAYHRFAIASVILVAISAADAPATETRPPFYGVYALQNGRFTEIPQAIIVKSPTERTPDDTTPRSEQEGYLGYIIHDPPGATFRSGRLSFVIYDRSLGMVSLRSAIIWVVARIRGGMEKDGSGNILRNLDVTQFESQRYLASYHQPYWIVRSRGYEFRVAPYGDRGQMMMLRSTDPAFSFPPGRYRLALFNHNYDFSVEPMSAAGGRHCVDLIQWRGYHLSKYQTFEECAVSRAARDSGTIHLGRREPDPEEASRVSVVTPSTSGTSSTTPQGSRSESRSVTLGPWQQYSYAADYKGFRVESPVSPIVLSRANFILAGPSAEYRYEMDLGTDSALVRFYDYSQSEGVTTSQALNQLARETAQELKGTIVGRTLVSLEGHPGIETWIEGSSIHARVRTYIVSHRVYELRSVSPTGQQFWPDTDRFFSSFSVTDNTPRR